ncbi:MAG: hypothetical protein DRI54_07780 [Bacteroidetes bacterium]|nr:MAG: hypothetical protein DRI54_07780 [Bacteroidota bacterium]
MRKILLVGLLFMATAMVNAQVVFYIQAPSPLEGSYNITYVGQETGTTDWGSPNMDDPANVVIGELVMALDGTEGDSLLCEAVVNGDDVNGKIAVYYRKSCEFGVKALNAQNAGAIAAIIINSEGEPIEMGGGEEGGNVTIPVAMISTLDGVALRGAIEEGGLTAFFGNKSGFYDNDLGINASTVLRAEHSSHPRALAENADDYTVLVGANVINYGNNTQTDVTLSAEIKLGDAVLYSETSETPVELVNGDTVRFDLPTFAMEPFEAGFYNVLYTVNYGQEDEFPSDNVNDASFLISDSLFAYARVDPETGEPLNITGSRPGAATEEIRICVAFQHQNASKVVVEGMTFAAGSLGETLEGELVDAYIYEWEAEFADVDDPAYELSNDVLNELTDGSYEFLEDLDNQNIYVPFDPVITLQDEVRYLFCMSTFSTDMLITYDSKKMDYAQNLDFYRQPLIPQYVEGDADGPWFDVAGTPFVNSTDHIPAYTIKMRDPLYDAINEEAKRVEITPFPNPTANEINIPVGSNYGNTLIDVYDIAGKKVKSLNVTTSSFEILKVNVSDLDNGAYIFKMNFEDGSFSNFNVVVNN